MIKPTVGRIVWYRPCLQDTAKGMLCDGDHLAAMIVHVHHVSSVNLCVYDSEGATPL